MSPLGDIDPAVIITFGVLLLVAIIVIVLKGDE